MVTVDVASGVPEESVHDVLPALVQAVNDGVECHRVLGGVDDKLKVGVAHLRQKDVDTRSLLKPPSMLMLEKSDKSGTVDAFQLRCF